MFRMSLAMDVRCATCSVRLQNARCNDEDLEDNQIVISQSDKILSC